MGAIIYQLYFTFQGSIIFTFISYLLYTLCKSKRPVSCRLYVLFSFLGFFILQKIIDWFITDLLKKASPYCVFLLSLGVAALFSSFIFTVICISEDYLSFIHSDLYTVIQNCAFTAL